MEKKQQVAKSVMIEREESKYVELPDIVELYFERADKPGKGIVIRVPVTQMFDDVVREAARKLKFKNTRVGVLGGALPISFVGKTVLEVIREANAVNFQLASADLLG